MDLFDQLKGEIQETNLLIVRAVDDLNDEQVAWQPGGTAPSIGFHLWHSARWADSDREAITGQSQIWRKDGYAERWGLASASLLGEADTGTGLSDDQSAAIILPGKHELVSYVEASLAGLETMLDRLPPEQLVSLTAPADGQQTSVQGLLFTILTHINRHLGMIEALKGLQGLKGTATR